MPSEKIVSWRSSVLCFVRDMSLIARCQHFLAGHIIWLQLWVSGRSYCMGFIWFYSPRCRFATRPSMTSTETVVK